MEADFWHARWREGQIGFHQHEVSPLLVRHAAALGGGHGSRVLVPLCGKSLDLAFLAQRGHEVIGVELSPLAVQAFFAEQGLAPNVDTHGPFLRHRAPGIEILCGDLFALTPALLGPVQGLFDRAALVALPEDMRARYAAHITGLMPPGARGLLISFDYEPPTGGPPFSISAAEVQRLYAADFELAQLERNDILEAEPRFKQRGITALYETAYQLVRR